MRPHELAKPIPTLDEMLVCPNRELSFGAWSKLELKGEQSTTCACGCVLGVPEGHHPQPQSCYPPPGLG